MSRRFWLILVVLVVALGVIFKLTDKNKGTATNNGQPSQHIEGLGQDGVTLVEYGDYQCPYCGEYYPIVKQVQAQYNDQIYFQFRNLPLTSLHPNAFAGARAAEAASLQGKFWQMHDLLYEQNGEYYDSNDTYSTWISASNPLPDFDGYAQQLGLNVSKFETDYASTQVNNTINADVAAFAKTGLQEATPTFILDGTQIQPGPSASSFDSFINAAIAKKTGSKSTTPAPTNSTTAPQSVQNTTTKK